MAIKKAEAIILHGRKQGETSKILTFYTREFGKMSAMAKGSRGPRSKYLGALETFNHVSLVFYQKEGRGLQYLSDASIINAFPTLHAQLGKMALAAVACEIIDKSEQDDHRNPEQFQLLFDTLQALNKNETGLRNIIRAFQVQYMSMAGFEPMLDKCHFCKKTSVDEINYFFPEHGMYSCNDCGQTQATATKVSGYVIELLRWLQQAPVQKAPQAKVTRATGINIDTILLEYLRAHIDTLYNLKSVEHLKQLESELSRTH